MPGESKSIWNAAAGSLDFGAGSGYVATMELIEKLEARFGDLLGRIKQLEEDNRELATQLEAELGKKREVQERIEALLTKVQTSLD